MPTTITTTANADVCIRAIRHVASLFEAQVSGGPVEYVMRVRTETANPRLAAELSADPPTVDDYLSLRASVGGTGSRYIQLTVQPPLWYMTSGLGFDRDLEQSFATTLKSTLAAYQKGGRVPTFPAPSRPPTAR